MSAGDGIAALILAAGYSSRLGAFKPLLPLGGATVLEEAVQRFRVAGIDDIRVVTGHRAEEIDPVLAGIGVRRIFNAAYAEGMLSSVLAGLKSFEAHIAAFFLLPADIPLVKPRTLAALLRAYRQSNVKIVYPCFGGLRGHPPLIASACVAALPPSYEGGVRAYLNRYECRAQDLEVVDEAILMDCDTPEDFKRLQAYAFREDIPTARECQMLWRRYGTTKEVIAHCRLVAEVARTFAVHLNCAGLHLDPELIVAAGYLHDLAKGQPDHAAAGAQILEEMGYGRVGRIVAGHMDLPLQKHPIDESDLIYLADKYVAGDRLVSLQERFEGPLRKFADKPDILEKVVRRLKNTQTLKGRVEKALGIPLAEIMQRREKSMRMASEPEPREIYLVRHGAIQPQGNIKRYIGQMDLPLSAEGVRQAEALQQRLRQVPISAIFCSDLQRSVETARIIAAPHGLDPGARPDLREIALGAWEGLSFAQVQQMFPQSYEERGRDLVLFRPPGGESFLDCALRVIPALYDMLQLTSGNLLIVGHAGVNRILLSQLMGNPAETLFDIAQDYGCLNLIFYHDFSFRLQVVNASV